MKKLISAILAVIMIAGSLMVTACKGKNKEDSSSGAQQSQNVTWHKEDYTLPKKQQFHI